MGSTSMTETEEQPNKYSIAEARKSLRISWADAPEN